MIYQPQTNLRSQLLPVVSRLRVNHHSEGYHALTSVYFVVTL